MTHMGSPDAAMSHSTDPLKAGGRHMRIGPTAGCAVVVCAAILSMAALPARGAPAKSGPPKSKAEIARDGGPHRFWPAPADPVKVVRATFLGGAGTEFLVGGGFQPDGSVILVGNCLGPRLGLSVPEKVLGPDLPAPPEAQLQPARDKDGQVVKDSSGQVVLSKLSWAHEAATAFAVRCDPDLKRILSVSRFPWKSAAATAAWVGSDGAVYVAGRPGAVFDGIGKTARELPAGPMPEKPVSSCERAFVARLAADLSAIEWLRTAPGPTCSPTLGAARDGAVALTARDWHCLDSKGEPVKRVSSPVGLGDRVVVHPIDGVVARGGCWMQGTGREPYKNPYLQIFGPDGALRYHLYNADSHYVGMDHLRLVSDSQLRLMTYDRDGNLLFYAWSDGGNSVMTRMPADVKRGVPFKGVGLTAAGAGATSFAYIVRLESRDYQVTGWTFWCTRYGDGVKVRHKANGIGVDAIAQADDGSICVAGDAAWGLVRTPDHLNPKDAEPAGRYVVVFNGEMDRVRFCTALPATGMADVNDGAAAAFACGVVKGRAMVLLAGGAVNEAEVYGKVSPAPTVEPLQKAFGGGLCDGYAMLMDLGPARPAETKPPAAPKPPDAGPAVRLSYLREARGKSRKEAAVPEGTKFYFSPGYPRHETVDAEFRDAAGRMWPSLLYGKPESGIVEWTGGALKGSVVVQCDRWVLRQGLQNRKALGELLAGLPADGPMPVLRLALNDLGPLKTEAAAGQDGKSAGEVTFLDAKGTLDLGPRRIAVAPRVTVQMSAPGRDGAINPIRLTAWLTLRGKELGLVQLAGEEIDARISFTGSDRAEPPPTQKNKK
jgi:hypothetical protein